MFATAQRPVTPAPRSEGIAVRCAKALMSPWSRLALLLALLACAATVVVLHEPQRLFADGWPTYLSGGTAALFFAGAYGVCTAALVPRPLLNLAAGALLGSSFGIAAAVGGTVLGAGIAFGLGRLLGRDALRPLMRGRWLSAADRQLSRHGFRSMLAVRLLPGVPFAAANYCASVTRMRWASFLVATGLGCVPNTAAYVVAGSRAATPDSPLFAAALVCIAGPGLVAAAVAWRKKRKKASLSGG